MRQAQQGDTVQVHYRGTLQDGTEFDSSQGGDPIEFTIGSGQVVPGFESAVAGMAPGEKKTATIPAAEAYGNRREDLMFQVNREQVPPDVEVSVGDRLQVGLANGESIAVEVASVDDGSLTLDANHPLAGKDLVFELELVEIG
ncbi:MAG TPA: peptidylprolyl isomerase [Thermoanaerobaculia bacterium]|nr:peptidylprolyl isomerase [Thermoanaerobaculia bacterium]